MDPRIVVGLAVSSEEAPSAARGGSLLDEAASELAGGLGSSTDASSLVAIEPRADRARGMSGIVSVVPWLA